MIGIFIWTMIFLFAGVFIGYAIGSYLEMQKREEPRVTKQVKKGGKHMICENCKRKDDVCEYRITDKMVYASCNNKQIASAFCWFNECGDYKYCPYCGKKIKVVE